MATIPDLTTILSAEAIPKLLLYLLLFFSCDMPEAGFIFSSFTSLQINFISFGETFTYLFFGNYVVLCIFSYFFLILNGFYTIQPTGGTG